MKLWVIFTHWYSEKKVLLILALLAMGFDEWKCQSSNLFHHLGLQIEYASVCILNLLLSQVLCKEVRLLIGHNTLISITRVKHNFFNYIIVLWMTRLNICNPYRQLCLPAAIIILTWYIWRRRDFFVVYVCLKKWFWNEERDHNCANTRNNYAFLCLLWLVWPQMWSWSQLNWFISRVFLVRQLIFW